MAEPSSSANPQPSTSTEGRSTSGATTSKISLSINQSTNDRDLFNTSASTFAKSAPERNKSFKERKELLILNARRRYIEKHNLDLTV